MYTFLLLISFLLIITGIIGSFLPVIPGPLTSWLGLFSISYINDFDVSNLLLIITLILAIIIFIVDYFMPIIGSKLLGGTKYGVIGTTIGLIIGLLSPIPFGLLIGAFLGALTGEIIAGKNINEAIKPALGSIIGVISSSGIKFITSFTYMGIYFWILWSNLSWSMLF